MPIICQNRGMRRTVGLLFLSILAADCGAPRPKPRFEGNPDWVGRPSGVFPGPKGAAMIEGIAAGRSQDKADVAACAQAASVLRLRVVAMLPATDSADTVPALKLRGERVITRWINPEGGAYWSLCVIERDGVKSSLALSLQGRLKDFMLVQLEQILSAPPK